MTTIIIVVKFVLFFSKYSNNILCFVRTTPIGIYDETNYDVGFTFGLDPFGFVYKFYQRTHKCRII